MITHDITIARAFAHKVAVMKDGTIVEFGAAEAVLETPQHPYTRRLLQAVPRIRFRR
jgi:ABC-type dipeptide/oligopeptide/nickel transport system ATPase component